MKVCVLQPDYSTSGVDYRNYDPPRDLSRLLPDDRVDHVFLNKLSTYRQLKALRDRGYDIFVNLCEGYLEWDVPSVDVVYGLEMLDLPFTGPVSRLYDPSKPLMKYVAFTAGVTCPRYVVIRPGEEPEEVCRDLAFPLFVKPAGAGDSLGIDEHSLVETPGDLAIKVKEINREFGDALVEEYIAGREFTVLVAAGADAGEPPVAWRPLEFLFPAGPAFKTYELKVRQHHPESNVPCTDPDLDERLREAARRIFLAFEGTGYARLDFRVDERGELFFLEINFTCSVFYPEGYEGSADYILRFDGAGQAGFLRHIIAEGLGRHRRRQKPYEVRPGGLAGYGIYARRDLEAGEVIFRGEERAQRLVTRSYVENHWPEEAREIFRRYAYPVSEEVFILWDEDPREWAPQNHSCAANTVYRGLNVIAVRDIFAGEELTLDYADFLDERMEPFFCRCGSPDCRGWIRGRAGNSVTKRERGL